MGKRRTYRELRYDFGRQLLMLRTRASLTQRALAAQCGLHLRSVQNWESGESYPKAETLQRVLAVFHHCGAFTPGREIEEARKLWRLAEQDGPHSLPPFDEHWFSTEVLAEVVAHLAQLSPPTTPQASPPRRVLIDWGAAMAAPTLYGREQEMKTLHRWAVQERCRVIALLGLGGIGKSSLVITFAHTVSSDFEVVLFHSLQNAPPLLEVLDHLLHALVDQPSTLPEPLPDKLLLLQQLFRERRCLLILDNLETLMQPGVFTGTYRLGYEEYGTWLKWLGEQEHQSCVLLTSREKPVELGPLEGRTRPVRTMLLTGLDAGSCHTILEAKDIAASSDDVQQLTHLYGGNPLALNLVSESIRELFGGDVAAFLSTGDAYFNGVDKLLEQQFARSTSVEQRILRWLAIAREAVTVNDLLAILGESSSREEIFEALESLRRRMQIERSLDQPAFALQPVILEYLAEQLVELAYEEIVCNAPQVLQEYALMQAHAKDYVRRSQERLLLEPLLRQLLKVYGDVDPLISKLGMLLGSWRDRPVTEQGYGPGNVVNLLRLLRGDLRSLNLSRLLLREVYWQGVEAQESQLTNAWIRDNVFTETFGIVHAVAVSPLDTYWAASSITGTIQIWRSEGRIVHLSIPAHTKHVKTLAFSPDERLLATGSWDCTIKLWEMQSGALVRILEGHLDYVQDVAFSPDGSQLVSVGDDQTLRIWDVTTGSLIKTIHTHSDRIYGTAWSPNGKWIASCGFDLLVRVWDAGSGKCVHTFAGHLRTVSKVAFSPDSLLLASGGYDRTLRVWELASGTCIKTFAEHESTVMALDWHVDGRTLATCSYDGTIRLWQLDQESSLRLLIGHESSINSIAFTASGSMLLSGSDDQTLRVWELSSGLCARVVEGYGFFFSGVVWSPDGNSLLSANSDTTLTLWNVDDGSPRLTLRGHTHTVYGVAWSPDGEWLASNGFDQTLRLWDAKTGVCVQIVPVQTDIINRVVKWSPDGRWLASAGRDQSVRIWDIQQGSFAWAAAGHTRAIHEVAWSPDGRQLASCSDDHTIRLWRADDGALLRTLTGHESSVAGIAWSPDGRLLASSGGGGTVDELFVWDAASGERVQSLVGHGSVVLRIGWSHDGRYLISGGMTGSIHWWDVASGASLYTRQSHQGWIRSLSVSPDGSMLVSSGEDGVIHLWKMEGSTLIRTLRFDRPYERMEISGLKGVTKAQRTTLKQLGAVEQSNGAISPITDEGIA